MEEKLRNCRLRRTFCTCGTFWKCPKWGNQKQKQKKVRKSTKGDYEYNNQTISKELTKNRGVNRLDFFASENHMNQSLHGEMWFACF